MNELLAGLRRIVAEHRALADDHTPLELDSLELVLIMEAVEDELGIRLEAQDLTPEHFRDLASLAALAARRRA